MNQYPTLRRWLAALVSFAALGAVVVVAATSNRPAENQPPPKPSKEFPWPMWGGQASRNMVNLVDKNVPTVWDVDSKKNILWVQDLGSKAYGGPVVGDGKIFIGTNNEKPRDPTLVDPKTKQPLDKGIIMCFEEGTGKFLWQRVHDKLPGGQVSDWPREGICSTPFIDGKHIYYVSNRCELVCATTDGKDVWSLNMIKDLGVFPHNLSTSSPVAAGNLVFVVTSNGVNENHLDIPAPQAPSFVAVDKKTRAVKWKNNDPSKNWQAGGNLKAMVNEGKVLMHGQWSSPCYAEVDGKGQAIFPGGDGWLRSFEPETGNLIWKFDCNPKSAKYELGGKGTRNDFISTPVVYENRVYIGVGQDPEHNQGVGHFFCIDITKKGDVSPGVSAKTGDTVYDPKAPENKDSALVWHYGEPAPKEWRLPNRNYVFGRTMSTAAIHDGLCYIGELAGYLHCLDAKTGAQYWVHNTGSATWSSPYWVDGKIYFGNDGEIMTILEHGKKKRLVGEPIEMGAVIRSTPVVANGILYLVTENKLYAIKAK
jgi:outer membrane protein assembly factor BamB